MNEMTTQEVIFRAVRSRLPDDASLSDVVSEILHVSADSAYRRIRGETPLLLEEAIILCRAFDLSLDTLHSLQGAPLLFTNVTLDPGTVHYEDFLSGLTGTLDALGRQGGAEVYYLTKDIPLFHNYYFTPLAAFRYYFWMRNILEDPAFADKGFSFSLLPESTRLKGEELVKAYTRVPSVEIWNTECVNSTISQIEFSREAGSFDTARDIREVYDALEASLSHLQQQVEVGEKFIPGEEGEAEREQRFRFFYNRIVLGDNSVLVVTDQYSMVYFNYDVLNYMWTKDKDFCAQRLGYLGQVMRKATLISGTGERQRNLFFNHLRSRIRERVQKI